MLLALATALLAWGVLAFGAVYPWASVPLLAGILAIAICVWRPRRGFGAPAWAAVLVLASIAAQIVPIGITALQHASPAADRLLKMLDIAYASGVRPTHALSIDPTRTTWAFAFAAGCMLWVPACAALLGREPARLGTLARNVAVLGTIVAVIGLAQKATFNGKLLWFWTPQFFATNGFGPFVNRNHFAGWMLLALTMSVGLFFGRLSRSPLPARGWRDRLLWIGSPAAAPLLMLSAAVLVMACALVWTMSRSGIASAGVALTVLLGVAMYRARGGWHRWVLVGYLLCTILGVIAWRGGDTLVGWYGRTATLEWRMQLWRDTVPALEDFWITGSGLNTYSTLMIVQPHTDTRSHPNAAHNDYLQLAVEGGVLVGVPALLLALAAVRAIARALRAPQDEMTWWIRMGAVAGVCGIAVQEISEFSLQIPGVSLLFATCLAVAVHRPAAVQARRHSRPDAARAA